MYKKHQNQQESNPSHHTPGSLTAMSASVGEDAPTEETIPGNFMLKSLNISEGTLRTHHDTNGIIRYLSKSIIYTVSLHQPQCWSSCKCFDTLAITFPWIS